MLCRDENPADRAEHDVDDAIEGKRVYGLDDKLFRFKLKNTHAIALRGCRAYRRKRGKTRRVAKRRAEHVAAETSGEKLVDVRRRHAVDGQSIARKNGQLQFGAALWPKATSLLT